MKKLDSENGEWVTLELLHKSMAGHYAGRASIIGTTKKGLVGLEDMVVAKMSKASAQLQVLGFSSMSRPIHRCPNRGSLAPWLLVPSQLVAGVATQAAVDVTQLRLSVRVVPWGSHGSGSEKKNNTGPAFRWFSLGFTVFLPYF